MKKSLLAVALAIFAITAFAQTEETKYRIPSGYQGFLEYGNTFVFDKEMQNTINLSTTHGFFMNEHTFVGIGLSIDFNNNHTLVPIYANMRYIFINNKAISPVLGLRLGSFMANNVGVYGDLTFGVRFASKRDFAISLLVSGTYYDNIKREREYWYEDENGFMQLEYKYDTYNPSGVSLRIGIEW